MDPIAYTYEADVHCPFCADARFALCALRSALDKPETVDNEGNPIGAIFSWNETPVEGLYCADCLGEIVEPSASNEEMTMEAPTMKTADISTALTKIASLLEFVNPFAVDTCSPSGERLSGNINSVQWFAANFAKAVAAGPEAVAQFVQETQDSVVRTYTRYLPLDEDDGDALDELPADLREIVEAAQADPALEPEGDDQYYFEDCA